ncbi:oligosaccharide flippase family protein [Providencia huaxiensis]|uniref:oligosaccharide flippase family protein n=1 Tax=Providencia huaxiensis TaxID=2027290 RepID=UPI0034E482A0
MNKKILLNISWLIAEKGITILLVFWSEGLIARILTIEQYGQWTYSLNIVILASSIALISGAEIAVPSLSRNQKIKNEIISSIFIIRLVFAIIAYLTCILYSYYFVQDELLKEYICILSLIILLNEPFSIVINYYQSIVKIKSIVFFRLISLFIRCLTISLIYKITLDKSLIAYSRVLESLFLAIFLSILFFKLRLQFKLRFNITKKLLYRGLSFWPSLILMYVYLRLDRFFIEYYLDFKVLALYSIAIQIMEQLFTLIKIIAQSVSPIYIFKKQTSTELKNNLFKLSVLFFVVSLIIIVVMKLFLPYIINLIFGYKYTESASIAIELLPSIIFFSIDAIILQYVYREKLSFLLLKKWTLACIISFVTYYIYFNFLTFKNPALIYNINYFLIMIISILFFIKALKNERKQKI